MNHPRPSPWIRLKASVRASFGEIVFGMEDGTVSIFGLVFGLAVTAQSADQVLLAGATGAIAASVSMAAGVFLDNQSERDQLRVALAQRRAEIAADPAHAQAEALARLEAAGLAPATLAAIRQEFAARPQSVTAFDPAQRPPGESRRARLAHSAWMFVSNLIAGLTPVLPFAFLPVGPARGVSIALTVALLVALGVARARIGMRAVLPTVLQTLVIAGAAGTAGVVIARLLG